MKIRIGDNVKVISGRDKNKIGKVLTKSKNGKIIVEGVNMILKNLSLKQHGKSEQVKIESMIHISNVAYCNENGQTSKIGYTFIDGKKMRIMKKTKEVIKHVV